MTRRARFFVTGGHERGERVGIDGGDAHHIAHVLRLRAGDEIEIVDSAARAFRARIVECASTVVAELVAENDSVAPAMLEIDVAQALPKGTKMEYVVEKATELGAAAFWPFASERAIARETGDRKLERWRRIARGAAEQSGRRDVPQIHDPVSFAALLERFSEYDLVLFPWENADPKPLRDVLPALLSGVRRVLVVIGSEGGFTHAEAEAARARDAAIVSLGRRVLRTETAALAVLAVLAYASAG